MSAFLASMSSELAAISNSVAVALMTVPFIYTALPLIPSTITLPSLSLVPIQTASWSAWLPLDSTNSQVAKSILLGGVASTMLCACSAGVGAGLMVKPAGCVGLALICVRTSAQPSSAAWYFTYRPLAYFSIDC